MMKTAQELEAQLHQIDMAQANAMADFKNQKRTVRAELDAVRAKEAVASKVSGMSQAERQAMQEELAKPPAQVVAPETVVLDPQINQPGGEQ